MWESHQRPIAWVKHHVLQGAPPVCFVQRGQLLDDAVLLLPQDRPDLGKASGKLSLAGQYEDRAMAGLR